MVVHTVVKDNSQNKGI